MKCIRCGHDSKYKDRTGMRCPACRGEFAFEPAKGALLSDTAFQHAVDAVSSGGHLRWGVEHLYYAACRRWRRGNPVGVAVVLIGLALIGAFLLRNRAPVFVLAVGVAAVVVWQVRRARAVPVFAPLPMERFNEMWARWLAVHGTPKGVITRRPQSPKAREPEPDLPLYSFDRAVICDRARTVDLLLANNFHFENNCAVLSIGGYPEKPFQTVRAMLKRNPRLHVFALHDATVPGCRLAHRLANDPGWFKDQVPVIDVGLRPSHAAPFRGLFLHAQAGRVPPGEGVTEKEAAWLSQYTLELAAIRPEQVLKRLSRAINRRFDEDTSTDGTTWGDGSSGVREDTESFSQEAGSSDDGPDGFG